jgi:uncharacterized protein (DUF3820 family)
VSNLTDKSKMPFGKYEGVEMVNVPAEYLLWIFENNKCSKEVAFYIKENLESLKLEIGNHKRGIK